MPDNAIGKGTPRISPPDVTLGDTLQQGQPQFTTAFPVVREGRSPLVIKTALLRSELDRLKLKETGFKGSEETVIKGRTSYFIVKTPQQYIYYLKILIQTIDTSINSSRTSLHTPDGPIHVFSFAQPSYLNLSGMILSQIYVDKDGNVHDELHEFQKEFYENLLGPSAARKGYEIYFKTPEGYYKVVVINAGFSKNVAGHVGFSMTIGILSKKGKYLSLKSLPSLSE